MLESLPLEWLVTQRVPLVFFIVALLTKPSKWTQSVIRIVQHRFGNASDDAE